MVHGVPKGAELKMIKELLKRRLLARRGIIIDSHSTINYGIDYSGGLKSRVVNSFVHLNKMGEGCFIENATIYGDVELGRFVSITGPGTIIHSEIEKIRIGSFSSLAPNVSIIEFNHDMSRPTTYTIQSSIFGKDHKEDFITKGPVIVEEDVWIGANSVILSGVKIGRGAVIAAGSLVNKDVQRYAVVAGTPARIIKMRFEEEEINRLENDRWWEWDSKQLKKDPAYFRNGG